VTSPDCFFFVLKKWGNRECVTAGCPRYINVVYSLFYISGNVESPVVLYLTVYGGVVNTVRLRYNYEISGCNIVTEYFAV
jgi:hypothetical protein